MRASGFWWEATGTKTAFGYIARLATTSCLRPTSPCLPLGSRRGAGGRVRGSRTDNVAGHPAANDSLPTPAAVDAAHTIAFTGTFAFTTLVDRIADEHDDSEHNQSFHIGPFSFCGRLAALGQRGGWG